MSKIPFEQIETLAQQLGTKTSIEFIPIAGWPPEVEP